MRWFKAALKIVPTRVGVNRGQAHDCCDLAIVPTRVGVNRGFADARPVGAYCPHARGGEPIPVVVLSDRISLSPRAWG